MPSLRSLAAFCGLASLAAVASADSLTCQTVESDTNIKISRRFEVDYTSENNEYWYVVPLSPLKDYDAERHTRSAACSALNPACIIKPATVQEVSTVLKILNKNNETFSEIPMESQDGVPGPHNKDVYGCGKWASCSYRI